MFVARRTASVAILVLVSGCLSKGETGGCNRSFPASGCRCDENRDTAAALLLEADSESKPEMGGTLTVRIHREPSSLLSLIDSDPLVSAIVNHAVLETLVRVAPSGTAITAELAERYETDDDARSYTFFLDENARWHDGLPVTSADVVFTFERLTDPDGQAVRRGEFSFVSNVEALDEAAVKITLDRAHVDFLFSLAQVPILPAHVFGRSPLAFHPAAREPVGSGPFAFSKWVPSKLIELRRNEDWRGPPAYLDRIVFRVVPEDRVALDLYARGDLDMVFDLSGGIGKAGTGGHRVTYPEPRFEAWLFNMTHPVFSRVQPRIALSMLVDREAIRCAILRCEADLVETPWPRNETAEIPISKIAFDPDKAVALLREDGWLDRDGDGIREREGVPFSFSLLLPDEGRDIARAATVVQGDLARAGIAMAFLTVSRGSYSRRLKSRHFDVAQISVVTPPKFDAWLLLHSRTIRIGGNFGAYKNLTVDGLLEQLQSESSEANRRTIMQEIHGQLRLDQPLMFTFRPHGAALLRDEIRGISIRDGRFDLPTVWRVGGGR